LTKVYTITSTPDEFSIITGYDKITATFVNDEAHIRMFKEGDFVDGFSVFPEDAIAEVLHLSGVFEKVS
jgi:hypothetical protein